MTRGPIIAVALAALLAAEARADEPSDGVIIVQRLCAVCHQVRAGMKVSPNRRAPAFAVLAADPSITEYSLRVLLHSPHASMPQFALTPEDTDAAITYILSLKPPG